MADPITTGVPLAAGLGGLYAFSTAIGVPLPVALAAVLGATIAVNASERLTWSFKGILTALLVFALALALGVWGGPIAGALAHGAAHALPGGDRIPLDSFNPVASLLLAMLGQRYLLPWALKQAGVEAAVGGVAQ